MNPVKIVLIEDNPKEAELLQAFLSSIRKFPYTLVHHDYLSDGLEYLNPIDGARSSST